MSEPPAKIIAETQKLSPDAEVELFQLDTGIFGGDVYLFHNQRVQGSNVLRLDELEYQAIPLQASGFAVNGADQMPTPKLEVGNTNGVVAPLIAQYDNLVGATLRRIRTFRRHLDDGSDPDPTARLSDDVYYVNRKTTETKESIEFELASSLDVDGATLPRRRILARCQWKFRDGVNCPYAGEDSTCAKTVAACAAKFPDQALPFGGFPSVERVSLTA
jgi:lambda family phage minor tail protein L